MSQPIFQPLPDKPDHPALEEEVLARWEEQGTFEQLRARNRGGERFSFFDGPVTANKSLGVHTAWGRTLKDVFQRYKGLRGFDQRYQNGFDCQGLWIEVGVERELGLNSKREIEEYGLEEFARKCREYVVWSAGELWKGSKRLGMWMDWGNDYFTFSDTNIEYVWRMLRVVHERDWLYKGHRSTEWCPRCGTSISQHELIGSYVDRADPSLFVRFPLVDRPGESIVIWTTTPWTLPANVAAAVNPDAQYGRRANGEWVAAALYPDEQLEEQKPGSELVGWRYRGPFDELAPGAAVDHRVIPWDEVSLEDGTGIVHIAPGAGTEDFELSREHDLPVLMPVDESARFYDEYGWLHGLSTVEAAEQIIGNLEEKGVLVEAGLHKHRYPECWRCHTPLIFRIADDWFISVRTLRQQMLDANADVEWTPEYMGKRMDDWLHNMGDWNISRRRYYGLPLPFYPCSCGHLNVIGSRAELEERALGGLDQLEELRRPWIDRVPIACLACGEPVERIKEVGDVWLDAGIVPFSTLGWQNETWIPEGNATGAAKGLTTADLPDNDYWETWFPADWVSEMREQIRLWFYSQLLHVRRADRARAVRAGARLREDARRERPRDARLLRKPDRGRGGVREDGRRRHALAVLRAAAGPESPLRLPRRRPDQAGAADALELRVVLRHVREHRRVPAGLVLARARGRRPEAARPVARRADARVRRRRDRRVRVVADERRRSATSRNTSTICPTGTSAARARASGPATRPRCRRCGTRSCRRCGSRADHAVPHGSPLAEPRRGPMRGRAGVGASRAVAGDGAARPGAAG